MWQDNKHKTYLPPHFIVIESEELLTVQIVSLPAETGKAEAKTAITFEDEDAHYNWEDDDD